MTDESKTPRTDGELLAHNYGHDLVFADFARQLERELAAYQQAEMPEEPGGPNQFEDEVDYISAHFAYAHALRSHAARVTVELAAAKEAQIAIQETCRAQYENYEKSADEIMQQRDAAEDALQDTHIALGGDGEWSGKLPPESPPNSGDLKADVPALAEEVLQRAESAERKLAECEKDAAQNESNADAWEYKVNGLHICYSHSKPPEDAFDEGTLKGLVYVHRANTERENDSTRLETMVKYEWRMGWTREGEHCRVFHLIEEDGWEPVCGWKIFFTNPREAIDAAIAKESGHE